MNIRYPIYEGVYRILTLQQPPFQRARDQLAAGRALRAHPGRAQTDGRHGKAVAGQTVRHSL